jgi:methyltransferase
LKAAGQERVLARPDMAEVLRSYTEACNGGQGERIAACFVQDAVSYFPPGMYGGPFRGASVIAEKMLAVRAKLGSYWTLDSILADPATSRAVCEWTHFKTRLGVILRGSDWIEFDRETGLIKEIRVYYASPQDTSLKVLELDGFDYSARGYATTPPPGGR